MRTALIALSVAMLFALPARADDEAPPKTYTDLIACRSIEDSAARLACFDKNTADFEAARAAREIVLLDKSDVRKTRKSLFGFSLPDLPFFKGDNSQDEEEIKEIESTIASVAELGMGRWQFTIPEGGTWQTTEALTFPPKVGQKVTIKKGIAGGYMVKVGKSPIRRVKRVD